MVIQAVEQVDWSICLRTVFGSILCYAFPDNSLQGSSTTIEMDPHLWLPWTVRYCVYFKFADRSFGRSLDIHASASLRPLIVYFSCSYHSLVRFSTLSFILSQLPTRLLALEKPSPRLRVRYHLIIGNQYSFRNCSSNCSIG